MVKAARLAAWQGRRLARRPQPAQRTRLRTPPRLRRRYYWGANNTIQVGQSAGARRAWCTPGLGAGASGSAACTRAAALRASCPSASEPAPAVRARR